MRIHFEQNWLPDAESWQSWALNEVPWLQCVDPEYHHTLPRLTSWYNSNPDGLMPMDDRLLSLLRKINDHLWLDLSEVNCYQLQNEEHKLGWKHDSGDRVIIFLSGGRKAMAKRPDKTREDFIPNPGDLLSIPGDCEFSVPRTTKPKEPFIFLVFS